MSKPQMEWTEARTAKATHGKLELYVTNRATEYEWTIWQGRTRVACGRAKRFNDAQTTAEMRAKEFEP